jgi:rsbT co-antagonist protein RsbR
VTEGTTGDEVQAELARARARIAELTEALEASARREEALRESEASLRIMFEGGDDGGWDWNAATGETYLSDTWFRILGYRRDELESSFSGWTSLIHPEDLERVSSTFKSFIDGELSDYDIEYRMAHKSGRLLWIAGRSRIVARDAEGRATRLMGTITDITRRKEAEEALRRSRLFLTALLDNSPATIFIRDLDFRFVLVNKQHASTLGMAPEQVHGMRDEELLPPELIKVFREADKKVLASGKPVAAEEAFYYGGAHHAYLSVKFPLYNDRGEMIGIGGISSDISPMKQAERDRAALQERVIEGQRAALRELSTPLIPIADDVVVMPLIGTIDSQRAQQLMEVLLGGVSAHRAATVIVDVTGVSVVDTHVAGAIVRASRAVRLLGAEVVLTGIRPEVATTLAGMGAELGGVVTRGTLQSGISYAMGRARGSF